MKCEHCGGPVKTINKEYASERVEFFHTPECKPPKKEIKPKYVKFSVFGSSKYK